MSQKQNVVHVQDGIVRNVYCSETDAEVLVVDCDVEAFANGFATAAVVLLSVLPVHELAGSNLESAINAAFDQGVVYDAIPCYG